MKGINYLEVGVYKGSTMISMLRGNEHNFKYVLGIDNFAEFDPDGKNFAALRNNVATHLTDLNVEFLEKSCWDVTEADVNGASSSPRLFNIYFYDGPHDEEDHVKAVVEYAKYLSDEAIFIVDDYNQDRVRAGTKKGLEVIGEDFEVTKQWEILSRWNGDVEGWWDGLGVFVLRRRENSDGTHKEEL